MEAFSNEMASYCDQYSINIAQNVLLIQNQSANAGEKGHIWRLHLIV